MLTALNLKHMKACAAKMLAYFIEVMPDAPFTEDDVVIEFVKPGELVEKYLELRDKYAPEHIINESQERDLRDNVVANALIGRETSAVLICYYPSIKINDMRRILFHEFMHIYCAKMEMDGEHFIDIYGTGTTWDTDPLDMEYDGLLASGYILWSEFIATYYAILHTEPQEFSTLDIKPIAKRFMRKVTNDNLVDSKATFAYVCSYLFNCTDSRSELLELYTNGFIWDRSAPYGKESHQAFLSCTEHLSRRLSDSRPCRISEEFISELGAKFISFRMMNSMYQFAQRALS